jgi:flavoprotein
MVKIQIELSEEEDKIVEIYKLVNKLKTKQEAIKNMIIHFEVDIKPKTIKEKDYFKTF